MRSETIFQGYFKDPEATAEVLDEDGWLKTGDIGEIDEDGFLHIRDRKKDILVTAGGKNVAPQNIENELKTSTYVSQALAVGDRRPYVAALVTLDAAEIGRWAAEQGSTATSRASPPTRACEGSCRRPSTASTAPLALRADQALRDPPARLHDGRRGDHADAEAPPRIVQEHFAETIDALYAGGSEPPRAEDDSLTP